MHKLIILNAFQCLTKLTHNIMHKIVSCFEETFVVSVLKIDEN